MRDLNLSGIDLKNVKVFISAAAHLSFTAAGHELFLTQSAVSKNISALENTLGIILFVREKGKVRLTPAGHVMYERLDGIIRQFEAAVEQASFVQEGMRSQLRIGIPNYYEAPYLMPLLDQYKKAFPESFVHVETQDFFGLRRKLESNELDVILTVLFEADTFDISEVEWKLLDPMPLSVFLSKQNPLAQKNQVSLLNLKHERFICYSPALVPGYIKMLTDICTPQGFSPYIGRYVDNHTSFLLSLMLNEGIVIADRLLNRIMPDDIVSRNLIGTVSGKIAAWRKKNRSKNVDAFIDLLFTSG